MTINIPDGIHIDPNRLLAFQQANLAYGAHGSTFNGEACSMEWVSYLAGEGFTDAPQCASPVLTRYIIRLNDRWNHEQRQTLKPYLLRTIGTRGDGKDPIREKIAARYVVDLLVPWLRLAGLDAEADRLAASGDVKDVQAAIYAARDAAWAARRKAIDEVIRPAVKAELENRGNGTAVAAAAAVAVADAAADAVADAAAVAVADAAADAVADAAADAVADAVAVADADAAADAVADAAAVADADADAAADAAADAVADAVADADADADAAADAAAVAVAAAAAAAAADAVADAAAAADADADADAVAVAAADAVADADPWGSPYNAAYKAAREYYRTHPLPLSQDVADLAADQQGAALALLDRLIDANEDGPEDGAA